MVRPLKPKALALADEVAEADALAEAEAVAAAVTLATAIKAQAADWENIFVFLFCFEFDEILEIELLINQGKIASASSTYNRLLKLMRENRLQKNIRPQ